MTVGNGLIGSLFQEIEHPEYLFFASGVSNSLETSVAAFKRERDLLTYHLQQAQDRIFVYFSSASIYDSSKVASSYVLHKLEMEELVRQQANRFLILRVSNAVGQGGNPNLLLNYLYRTAVSGQEITVHTRAARNLIDVRDIRGITLWLLEQAPLNRLYNVAYLQNFPIIKILEALEAHLQIPLKLHLQQAGTSYEIELGEVERYFKEIHQTDPAAYLKNLFHAYYPSGTTL